jgi:hypothetical protein
VDVHHPLNVGSRESFARRSLGGIINAPATLVAAAAAAAGDVASMSGDVNMYGVGNDVMHKHVFRTHAGVTGQRGLVLPTLRRATRSANKLVCRQDYACGEP